MKNPIFTTFAVSTVLIIGYLYSQTLILSKKAVDTPVKVNCVPTFRDGGGPYYKAGAPFRNKIAPSKSNGEVLRMKGKVIKSDCVTPIANAVLDIWQANESGNYEDEWYRGQVRTDNYGDYSFETVIPKGYGEGTGYRPPHLHFKVFVDGNEVVTSQMFFPEIKGQAGFNDAYIMKVASTEKNGKPIHDGYHDIILP